MCVYIYIYIYIYICMYVCVRVCVLRENYFLIILHNLLIICYENFHKIFCLKKSLERFLKNGLYIYNLLINAFKLSLCLHNEQCDIFCL